MDIPPELRLAPAAALEEYVMRRIKHFSFAFAENLARPEFSGVPVESVFNHTASSLVQHEQDSLVLSFAHKCKFLGCRSKECTLCINNPNKKCSDGDNLDESYADHQVIKSKCDADISVELRSRATGAVTKSTSGMQILVSVIDGEGCTFNKDGSMKVESIRELFQSDENKVLLRQGGSLSGSSPSKILLDITGGTVRLPDLHVTGKTDTFRLCGQSFASFRLMARAVTRDQNNKVVVCADIAPAVSAKFTVKSQRAMNDYIKPEFPHYKDKVTKLKYIGGVTAERLKDISAHIQNTPFTTIETVEQLKQLMLFTEQNRQIEGKLLDVLHMMGRHKHKWDYLKQVLSENVVYDDIMHRVWFEAEAQNQGLLFASKQGQVNLEKPIGMVNRVSQAGETRMQVVCNWDIRNLEAMKLWRSKAEESWFQPGHVGWQLVVDPVDLTPNSNGSTPRSGQMAPVMTGVRRSHLYPVAEPVDNHQADLAGIKQEPWAAGSSYHSAPFQHARHDSGSGRAAYDASMQVFSASGVPTSPEGLPSPHNKSAPEVNNPFSFTGWRPLPTGPDFSEGAREGSSDTSSSINRASRSPMQDFCSEVDNPFAPPARFHIGTSGGAGDVMFQLGPGPKSRLASLKLSGSGNGRSRRGSADANLLMAEMPRLFPSATMGHQHDAPVGFATSDPALDLSTHSKRRRASMPTLQDLQILGHVALAPPSASPGIPPTFSPCSDMGQQVSAASSAFLQARVPGFGSVSAPFSMMGPSQFNTSPLPQVLTRPTRLAERSDSFGEMLDAMFTDQDVA